MLRPFSHCIYLSLLANFMNTIAAHPDRQDNIKFTALKSHLSQEHIRSDNCEYRCVSIFSSIQPSCLRFHTTFSVCMGLPRDITGVWVTVPACSAM